jgi:hypothetical protein
MRDTIAENKKRPSLGDNLEKTIDKEILKDTPYAFEIGIGNINKLKTDAPYFEVLDAGGYVPYSTVKAAPPGSFEGDSAIKGGDGQNWERSGGKGLYMKPKKAIEGIDYIGKGIRFCEILLMTKISEVWKRWGSGFGGKG